MSFCGNLGLKPQVVIFSVRTMPSLVSRDVWPKFGFGALPSNFCPLNWRKSKFFGCQDQISEKGDQIQNYCFFLTIPLLVLYKTYKFRFVVQSDIEVINSETWTNVVVVRQ